VSSIAIYTWRKRINSGVIVHSIIYVTKHPNTKTADKLVIRAIDRNVFFQNDAKLPDTVLKSLPKQIKYVIGNGPYKYEKTVNQITKNINNHEDELAKTKTVISKILADCSAILNKTEI
jgi:hypothetical protein